jgi:hypothetical protein
MKRTPRLAIIFIASWALIMAALTASLGKPGVLVGLFLAVGGIEALTREA